jgi:uncharacterized cupin superfamily protein
MSDYTIMRADDAPDYTGDAPGKFLGYARPMGSEQLGVNLRVLEPGRSSVPPGMDENAGHSHDDVEELYFVLEGELSLKLDDDVIELGRWDAVRIPPQVKRAMRNQGDTDLAVLMVSQKMSDPQAQSHFHEGFWPS